MKSMLLLAVSLAALLACDSPDRVQTLDGEPATEVRTADPDFSTVARLQREFLVAMAAPGDEAARFISIHSFTFNDGTVPPDSLYRSFAGRAVMGQDYFVLSRERLTPAHATAQGVEVYTDRSGIMIVITTHDGADPTITVWQRTGEEWKVLRMTVNAQQQAVQAVREHYAAGSPRVR
jgi:hypothetical protein